MLLALTDLTLSCPASGQDPGRPRTAVKTTALRPGSGKPSVIVYFMPGMKVVGSPDFGEFEVAIWSDGRIIWSDPSKGQPRDERHPKRVYYQAQLLVSSVRRLLDGIAKADAFRVAKGWTGAVPDGKSTDIVVRDGKNRLVLSSWQDPPPVAAPSPKDAKKWAAGLRVWNLIRRGANALIPAVGTKLSKRPDDTDWTWNYWEEGRGR